MTRYTLANTFGTDHLSFNAVGLPAFQFAQDPLDYDLNTHHSNVDDVSHVPPGDLMQAAAVMAAAVYQAATRGELMPRKPLPAPLPARGEVPAILRRSTRFLDRQKQRGVWRSAKQRRDV